MARQLYILSVDFDYFQMVKADTLKTCYPDGHDLSTQLSEVVWSSYYAMPDSMAKLKEVSVNKAKIQQMQMIFKMCRKNIPVKVASSHVQIYDFISDEMRKSKLYKLNLTNVDLHHDMFNDNFEMDCGNWIKFVTEDFDTRLTWIANPVSRDIYGLNAKVFDVIKDDFSSIKPEKIDGIFMCRSDAWTPPHLDGYFKALLDTANQHFEKVICEPSVKIPRDVDELIKNQRMVISAINAKNRRRHIPES